MVVYLAVCDLLFSISHVIDHAYIVAVHDHPPDFLCSSFAFFLLSSMLSQWFVVVFSAVSACTLIVCNRRLHLGRWDWRLLVGIFGMPAILTTVAGTLNVLGPSGAWCLVDFRNAGGQLFGQLLSMFQICTFVVIALAYGTIWIKIRQTTRLWSSTHEVNKRYQNSARVMMIFVVAFIFQWWTLVLSNVWALFSSPRPAVIVTTVFIVNLGGLYNCVAYTVIRRRLQQSTASSTPRVVVDDGATHRDRSSCDNNDNAG